MSFYNNFIAGVFPDYAIKRIKAAQITAAYESAKTTRTHKPKRENRGSNAPVIEAAVTLREQGRYLEQNNDIAKGALDILVARTVGMGIIPEFMVEDKNGDLHEDVNDRLAELYDEWCRKPEVTWCHEETAAQRLTAKTLFRDGEVIIQHVTGQGPHIQHGTLVPYSYEMIESDQLPMDFHDAAKNIMSGITLNGWGRPVQYNLLKANPEAVTESYNYNPDTRPIPAEKISHLALLSRIRQLRGVSVFSSVIKRLQDIDEIDETERVATRMAAAMAVYIKKGDPQLYNAPDDDAEEREIEFNPGMVIDDLLPGEEIGSINSNRPNNQLIPFKDAQMRHAAGGMGVGYSSMSKNYNGNYSSQRQELVEQHDHYGIMWKYIVDKCERPKLENFIKMAVLARLVKVPADVNEETLYNVHFSRPAMPWIQPKQEADAWTTLIDNKIESRSEIIRSRGKNPRKVQKQIDRETKLNEEQEPQTTEKGNTDEK